MDELLDVQVRLLFLFRCDRLAIHTDRTLQIAILGFDHLVEFSSSRLLCLKLESPVAMVFGFSLDFIRDDLSDKFIRRCLRLLGKF